MMNSQESSATGYSPHELFIGRLAWFLHAPYPEDTRSSVGEWVQEQQAKVDKAKAMLQRVRERQWNKKNKHRVPATYQEGDWVLVHHSRLPVWPPSWPGCLLGVPAHQEGEGQGQEEGKGHQGALRQKGTEGPQVRAGIHRDRAPEEPPHRGRKPPRNQEGAGAGTKARRKRAPQQTPRPTPRKGIP